MKLENFGSGVILTGKKLEICMRLPAFQLTIWHHYRHTLTALFTNRIERWDDDGGALGAKRVPIMPLGGR